MDKEKAKEKAIKILRNKIECLSHSKCSDCPLDKVCDQLRTPSDSEYIEAYGMAIEALSTSEIPNKCEDAISRQAVMDAMYELCGEGSLKDNPWRDNPHIDSIIDAIESLPSVTPKQKMGHCKECKYFEYDSWAMVDGIPLIVAHEICSKWGGGCKTNEDGYCFLYEPQEREDTE